VTSRSHGAGGADDGAHQAVVRAASLAGARDPRLGRVRLVCVDGPAGSGKSTFAAALGAHLDSTGVRAEVVHLDDLYAGWSGLDGDLWPRLSAQVLEPLRRGWPGRFQRYDWSAAAFGGWVDVPVPGVLVLEGCGAGRRAAAPDAVLTVWVEAPPELRLRRGIERDGEELRPQWTAWTVAEAEHFAREGTRGRADLRIDAYGKMTA
jgi:hypothetical protein